MATQSNISARFQGFLYAQLSGMYNDIVQPVESSVYSVINRFKNPSLTQFAKEQTHEKVIDFSTRALLFGAGAYYCYKPLYNVGRQFGGCIGIISGFFAAYIGCRMVDKNVNRFLALSSCLYQGGDLFLRGETQLQTRLGGSLLAVTSLYMLNYSQIAQETSTEPHENESFNLAKKISDLLKPLAARFAGTGSTSSARKDTSETRE